jgi:SPP1 gp7 family putative phage head morphogenesis protein
VNVYAQRIRQALTNAIDTTALARLWVALHPKGTGDVSGPVLAEFLGRARQAIEQALRSVLGRLWPEAWVLGQKSAEALTAALEDVDWGTWTPGDAEAAMEVAGPGLRQLLDEAGITIRSITQTRLEELSAVLEESLASDEIRQPWGNVPHPPSVPVLSVQDLAERLEAVLDNPRNAELVAQAEIARAQSSAAMRVYAENGTRDVEWSTAEDAKVCPRCDANAAQGGVPIGTAFVSGAVMPPQHPRCRCALLPVLESSAA